MQTRRIAIKKSMAKILLCLFIVKAVLLGTCWAACGDTIDLIHSKTNEYSFGIELNKERCYWQVNPAPDDKIVMMQANLTCKTGTCGTWNNTVNCFYSSKSPTFDHLADCMQGREGCHTLRKTAWPPNLRTRTTHNSILIVKYWINTCDNTPQFNAPPVVTSRADTSTTASTTSTATTTPATTPAKTTKTPANSAQLGNKMFAKNDKGRLALWLEESRGRAQRYKTSTIALGVVSGILLLCICAVLIIYATSRSRKEEPIRLIRGPFDDGEDYSK